MNTASGNSAFFVISAGIKESFFAALLVLPCTGKSSSGFTGGGNGTNAFTDNRQAMPVHNGYTEAETCSTFGNCRTENGPCSKYFSIYADDDDVFVFVLFSFAVVLDAVVVVVIIIATAARLVQNASVSVCLVTLFLPSSSSAAVSSSSVQKWFHPRPRRPRW